MNAEDIRINDDAELRKLLALNNAHAVQTSHLEEDAFREMIKDAFTAKTISPAAALLLTFDQDAAYQSSNFLWFKSRYPFFVYVDRVIVDPAFSGRGLGRLLYETLFDAARVRGHAIIACEVNSKPPNPGSDAFHHALGFEVVGEASSSPTKSVRYMTRAL